MGKPLSPLLPFLEGFSVPSKMEVFNAAFHDLSHRPSQIDVALLADLQAHCPPRRSPPCSASWFFRRLAVPLRGGGGVQWEILDRLWSET